MNTFSYILPQEKIAQRPVHPAHAARLMLIDKKTEIISESTFIDIDEYLLPTDVIVFNNTKVLPARMLVQIEDKSVEIFLTQEQEAGVWRAIGKPMKLLRKSRQAIFSNGLRANISVYTERELIISFIDTDGKPAKREDIFNVGLMPIPPYIREGLSDEQDLLDYQTIFAKIEGSIAAPTASLHFTEEVMQKLYSKKVTTEFVTLHVGLASILGLGNEPPGSEKLIFDQALIDRIKAYKNDGRRIIAVGTTVVRALESMARSNSKIEETDLFIQPGFDFKFIDCLVTNFHMPDTTHVLLVEAFMHSRGLLEKSYDYALKNNFRFLSYGDGMLIE